MLYNIDSRRATVIQPIRFFPVLGNGEVQRILIQKGISIKRIAKEYANSLKIYTFLGDSIIQPTAHYYVPLTRQITKVYKQLLQARILIHSLPLGIPDHNTDLEQKKSSYAGSNSVFQNNKSKYFLRELESVPFHENARCSVGDLVGEIWTVRLLEMFSSLSSINNFKVNDSLLETLINLPKERGKNAFTWHYVSSEMNKMGIRLDNITTNTIENTLLQSYFKACEYAYDTKVIDLNIAAPLNCFESRYVESFNSFLQATGAKDLFDRIPIDNIINIKLQFDSFSAFRFEYFRLINESEKATKRVVEYFKNEIDIEKQYEVDKLRNIIRNSNRILMQQAQALGLYSNPSVFFNPKSSPEYALKKLLLHYERIPLIWFRDELIANFTNNIISRIIGLIKNNKPKYHFVNCDFHRSQFGDFNQQ